MDCSASAISAVALRMAESLNLPVVITHVAQELAAFFAGRCHVSFTPAQRPHDARQATAMPDGTLIPPTHIVGTPPPLAQAEPDSDHALARLIVPLIARGRPIGTLDVMVTASDDAAIRDAHNILQVLAAHAALAIDTADQVASLHLRDRIDPVAAAREERGIALAAVIHDLRQPLAALSNSIQLLVRATQHAQALDRDKLSFVTEIAEFAITQLDHQISALMPAARHERSPSAAAQVDLVRFTCLMAHVYQQTTDRHQITVVAGVPTLPGSWSRLALERVLGNLLTNGIKYSTTGGVIRVTVGREDGDRGGWVTLSVENDGIGIPAQDLPLIMQARYRAGNVGMIAGTGLGLMSVRTIVEQHGGTLTIQSAVGGTTTVLVRLPVLSAAATA